MLCSGGCSWKCYKTLTFCSLLTRCTIPYTCHTCHAKRTSQRPKVVQKPLVFLTFWLRNVLRTTTACTFSTSQFPKVVREWCGFVHFGLEMCFVPQRHALFRHLNFKKFTCKCASRHNGVQFFISHLASWLRTHRFSKPTFRQLKMPNKNGGVSEGSTV